MGLRGRISTNVLMFRNKMGFMPKNFGRRSLSCVESRDFLERKTEYGVQGFMAHTPPQMEREGGKNIGVAKVFRERKDFCQKNHVLKTAPPERKGSDSFAGITKKCSDNPGCAVLGNTPNITLFLCSCRTRVISITAMPLEICAASRCRLLE